MKFGFNFKLAAVQLQLCSMRVRGQHHLLYGKRRAVQFCDSHFQGQHGAGNEGMEERLPNGDVDPRHLAVAPIDSRDVYMKGLKGAFFFFTHNRPCSNENFVADTSVVTSWAVFAFDIGLWKAVRGESGDLKQCERCPSNWPCW